MLVPDRHQERVHAILAATGPQLREHHGHLSVPGGIPDVVLTGTQIRSVHNEVTVVVGRRGTQVLHVRTVPGLRHREAPRQGQGNDVPQVLLVPLGPQHPHSAAEQSPLDAGLDHQRKVAVPQRLEGDDRTADIVGELGIPGLSQLMQLLEHLSPVALHVEPDRVRGFGGGHPLPQATPEPGPPAIKDSGEWFGHGSKVPRMRSGHTCGG
jgi:hypothetical protein